MSNVLVLNYDYTPLNLTTTRRGFVLVDKGKAEIIKSDNNPILAGFITYVRPLIIRLLNYVKFNRKSTKVNRHRIFKRDNHECVYCGSTKQLTLDHVIPKSRGGRNEWTNLVACCFKCNLKKGNKTPEEAKMKLKEKPYVPSIMNDNPTLNNAWLEYQKSFVY
jgi:CRISPR/Cas system Type II protein with McrA/HNH and RuvC-like nuclease domain